VIVEPLTREWEEKRAKIDALIERYRRHNSKGEKTKAYNEAQSQHRSFLDKLKNFRVLDPACGSGNFLYLSLLALKDIEHRANLDAEALGLPREFPGVGPQCVKGIEINPFAAELARVSVWIGEIQWMKRNGFEAARSPILKPLETIECRDALLNSDGAEAEWPKADVIVGNPPFLGDKRMLSIFPETYVAQLRSTFRGRVSGGADLVIYWFAKALEAIREGRSERAGLVATQSVRRGVSSEVLKAIVASTAIFDAWSDEEWTVEGADVRVSLICFGNNNSNRVKLDGTLVSGIYADLSAADDGADLTRAVALSSNRNAFIGDQKTGPFDIEGELARAWLQLPMNPNGRPNSDVLKPWANGSDLTGRPSGKWIIDFGVDMPERAAALYEAPFAHVARVVRSRREGLREVTADQYWWLHQRPRPEMRQALSPLSRYIATPRVAKHRIFVWQDRSVLPDSRLVVVARGDDTSFGILHSRFHELWTLRLGGWHGVGNDPQYTPSLGYATFPFPDGLTPNIPAAGYANDLRGIAIAEAAKKLNELRETWLNPPDLVERVPEVVPGYPDRIVPKDDKASAILKKRTLTNLYNERPAWLDHAHRELDEAVAAAYGWPANLADEEILQRLFKLNQERAAAAAMAPEAHLV
jgi:type II restriction/modification system DNA methylase subunit YeeA